MLRAVLGEVIRILAPPFLEKKLTPVQQVALMRRRVQEYLNRGKQGNA